MTNTKQKINAVFLSALMVMSVFAAAVAFSGAAAASNRGTADATAYSTGPTDNEDIPDSSGDVGPGQTVFQGEDDLDQFIASDGSTTDVSSLTKAAGDNAGITLGQPISQTQETGRYTVGADGGEGVIVESPSISDVEVQNTNGGDVTGSTLVTADTAFVRVDYNYEEAEDVEITVEDEDGLDVTDEILKDNADELGGDDARDTLNPLNDERGDNGDFDVGFVLNPSNVDEGQYTITVEGVEDLDFGDASETVTVNVSSDQKASLNLDEDEVVQGSNLRFTVDESPEGNFHAVVIESSEFQDDITDSQAEKIFRSVGDVQDRGLNNGNAYAVVEIDGGSGVGSIETQYLDDSSIDVELYPANSIAEDKYLDDNNNLVSDPTGLQTDDDQTVEVVEGEISIDNPSGTYVTGSQVDVNGTANEGVDNVAIYARNNNDYELVTIDNSKVISVDGDDTFSEEDVQLDGDTLGNSILSLPGSYRVGVIDAQDAAIDNDNAVPDDTLTTSEFNSGVSSATSLRVTDTALNGTFTTYNGQIASEDGQIDVDGQAPGKDNVVVAFVDSRGDVSARSVSVDDDDTFSEEDLNLDTPAGNDLSEGTVTAHIISSGRDGTFGEDANVDASTFASDIEDYQGTGEQVRDRIIQNTVDDTASDDLIVNEQFRLTDGLTTVESATSPVEANGTIEVQGTTNREPDDNTITVELLNNEDESITVDSTDNWGTDGQYSVSVDLSDVDVEPGNYTIEVDDGDNTDRTSVTVVEAGSLEEEQPDTETPEPDTETPEPDTETPEPDTETPEPDTETPEPDTETEEATTEASGPGFTAAIALIALVAAALLAVRRDN
ncbi:major cell surface glycoprotein [Haloarcula sp. JP-Z28]|nr:HVO_2072 family ArtA-dependent S-layer glycoprotein [Haloarcula sp. JP-Z28]NHN66025.1 major cell surface glycoprotein [Haloarcula sp. JP-Z28]